MTSEELITRAKRHGWDAHTQRLLDSTLLRQRFAGDTEWASIRVTDDGGVETITPRESYEQTMLNFGDPLMPRKAGSAHQTA